MKRGTSDNQGLWKKATGAGTTYKKAVSVGGVLKKKCRKG